MDERPVCEQRRYSIVGVPRSPRSLPGQSGSRRPRRGSRAELDNLSGNAWRIHVSPAKRGAPPVVCASHALGRDQWSLQLSQREFPDLGVDFLPLRLHPAAARAAFYAALAAPVRRGPHEASSSVTRGEPGATLRPELFLCPTTHHHADVSGGKRQIAFVLTADKIDQRQA